MRYSLYLEAIKLPKVLKTKTKFSKLEKQNKKDIKEKKISINDIKNYTLTDIIPIGGYYMLKDKKG